MEQLKVPRVPNYNIPSQPSALSPRGKCKGPRDCMTETGDPIPWVVLVEGKRDGGFKLLLE
jgi:hypothetical protein